MNILSNLILFRFDALKVWRLVLVRPDSHDNNALFMHEMAHYREQRNCGVVRWSLLYAMSARFWMAAEAHCYLRQIIAGGISLERTAMLLMQYGIGITYEQVVCPFVSARG